MNPQRVLLFVVGERGNRLKEKVQEQEVQDLMLSVELERLVGSELRAQSSAGSAKAGFKDG